jgi:inosine-uridine nucleoside N-ribohydrolase
MGGAIGLGNWSPSAEFNIITDPEAAQIVFTCGKKITMVPL